MVAIHRVPWQVWSRAWLVAIVATVWGPQAFAGEPFQVFVSVIPQQYFVERIGGPHVTVLTMVGLGKTPATYDPSPRQIAALSTARIYFQIGVPFEQAWLPRIQALHPHLRIVDSRHGIPLQRGHGGHADTDPHVWTSPIHGMTMARNIRDALIQFDPDNAGDYRASSARLAHDLEALDQIIRQRLKDIVHREFLVFHPAWGYFAKTYGLKQMVIEHEGKTPGAKYLAGIIKQAKAHQITTVFGQAQFSPQPARVIAHEIGARVVMLDPLAYDYLGNLDTTALALARALGAP